MDFRQLDAFIKVAMLKSFSKAADSLFLSQPAVSSHISMLEKELGIQLFDRSSKEVSLTEAGNNFLNYAIDIINSRNNALTFASNYKQNSSSIKLVLAASTTPCNLIVPELINLFREKYPHIKYRIIEQSSGEIIDNILKFNCEIGIIGENVDSPKIKSYKLVEDELILISAPSLGLPKEISINSLVDYPFVMRDNNSATRKTFEDALIDNKINPSSIDICCQVNNLDSLMQFVQIGMGVSIVSKGVCADAIKLNKFSVTKIKDMHLKRSLYLIVSSKRTLTPPARAFFDLCKKHYDF